MPRKAIRKKGIVTLEPAPEKRFNANSRRSKSKYNNVITEFEGVKWASKYELACWKELRLIEKSGLIKNLKRQVTLKFEHNGHHLWTTRPDFYFEIETPEGKIEPFWADAKNSFTANSRTFKTSQKMMKAFLGKEMLVFLMDKKTSILDEIKNLKV